MIELFNLAVLAAAIGIFAATVALRVTRSDVDAESADFPPFRNRPAPPAGGQFTRVLRSSRSRGRRSPQPRAPRRWRFRSRATFE